MYIEEAVAAVQADPTVNTTRISDRDIGVMLKIGIRALYERTKNQSYKFRVGPIPVSIKIAKIKPLLEWWVGPLD